MLTKASNLALRLKTEISDIDDKVDVHVRKLNSGTPVNRRELLENLNRLQGRRVNEMEPSIFKDLDEILG